MYRTKEDEPGFVARESAGTLAVRYARRELRELTDGDRTAWLDALAEMWHKRMRSEIGIGHHDDPDIRST